MNKKLKFDKIKIPELAKYQSFFGFQKVHKLLGKAIYKANLKNEFQKTEDKFESKIPNFGKNKNEKKVLDNKKLNDKVSDKFWNRINKI